MSAGLSRHPAEASLWVLQHLVSRSLRSEAGQSGWAFALFDDLDEDMVLLASVEAEVPWATRPPSLLWVS